MKNLIAGIASMSLCIAPAVYAQAKGSANAQVAISSEVSGEGSDDAAAGDAAYAKGDYSAALAAYGEGFADTKDPDFLYAMAKTHQAMKKKAEAKLLFESYLAGSGELSHRSEAEAALGIKSTAKTETKSTGGALGGLGSTVGGTVNAAAGAATGVTGLAASVFGNAKVDISDSLSAEAKASAEKADQAYAAGKFEEAEKGYEAAYESGQAPVALFAEGMADAQAKDGAEARAELAGYLATNPKGEQAEHAKRMFLAMGGDANILAKVSVAGKVSKEAKADAQAGDKAFKEGRFLDAEKSFEAAFEKKSDPAAIYAAGMAEYAQGDLTEAKASFQKYLSSQGKLEFKAQAQAALQACGGAQ